MPLHPQARVVLDALEKLGQPDWTTQTPEQVRRMFQESALVGEGEQVARVEDRTLPGPAGEIPVRVYAPEGEEEPRPGVVYFHGGGFVMGSLETHDATCRSLANASGCTVVSVDYRLAPEHPFPAAPEDCYAATRWVASHGAELGIDPDRLAVAGDSAGGNLAAAVSLMARDRGGPALRHQVLIYPVADHGFDTPSYRENAEGYLLSRQLMEWFWGHYLARESDADHPYASPLRAPDASKLPPALVLTAEFDPLRDEGEAYAERLRAAGVPTRLSRYDGMIHGFFSMAEAMEPGRRAVDEVAAALRRALG